MVQGLKRFEESVGERPPVQQQTMGWMVQGLSLKQKAGLYPKVSRLTLSLVFFFCTPKESMGDKWLLL